MSIIKRFYQNNNADEYESIRNKSNKWLYEDTSMTKILKKYSNEIKSILDAPVGTGRFLNTYENYDNINIIYGIDFSKDMLKHAEKKSQSSRIHFIHADILNNDIQVEADMVVCYRFLNLLNWADASKVIINLLRSANKFALLSIRLVDNAYIDETYIEDKIYLHRDSDFRSLIYMHGFKIKEKNRFDDLRAGTYQVVLCKRHKHYIECRKAKSGRHVFVYIDDNNNRHKLYQAHNQSHAEFIRAISTNGKVSKYFPEVYNIFNDYLDVEWVNGESELKVDYKSLLSLLFDLYSLKPIKGSQFDYVNDLVLPRFMNLHPVLGKSFCIDIESKIQNSQLNEMRVSHPDLSPSNLVKTKTGYKVIDNELLCYSKHYHIDLLNLLKHTPQEMREDVFSLYLENEVIAYHEFCKNLPYLSALWLARETGSELVNGNIPRVLELTSKYNQQHWILPFNSNNI